MDERDRPREAGITADAALRFSKALGATAVLWMKLPSRFDIDTVENALKLADIERIIA